LGVKSGEVSRKNVKTGSKYKKVLDVLLNKMVELGGSDLHLKVLSPPKTRISGQIETLGQKLD